MTERKDEIDITDLIGSGDVKSIVQSLVDYLDLGYTKLFWDGYDSSIYIYKGFNKDD